MKLKFKKTHPKAIIPTRATPSSAGLDIHVILENETTMFASGEKECKVINNETTIPPRSTLLVRTGLSIQPERKDVALLVYPRSGLSTKYGIDIANCVAVIDSDYRGEIRIPLRNNSNIPFVLRDGDRVAQLVVTPIIFAETEEVDELDETERGTGGFGSTGR